MEQIQTKFCRICKQYIQLVLFGKRALGRNSKDGYSTECLPCIRIYEKNRKSNKKISDKKYYLKNKEKILAYTKKYLSNHEYKLKRNKNRSARRISDVGYRIENRLRVRLHSALKGKLKLLKTKELVGCSTKFLKEHLESQFKDGIAWDNFGDWHIDHVRPCASFDLSDLEQQKECFHFSNLQPLWAIENLRKSDRLNYPLK